MYLTGKTPVMKRFAFCLLLMLSACTTAKDISAAKPAVTNNCPAEGSCSVEILKGKSIAVSNDSFGRTAYSLVDAEGKNVVKYTYEKTRNPDYQDDFYSEEVIFETNGPITSEALNNKDAKMLFTVKCFCRGKAGTYKVSGHKTTVKDNVVTIQLPPNIIDNQLTREIKIALK